MNANQQVKSFAKQNGMKADAKNGVPTLTKAFPGGSFFIECFDNWQDALAYVVKAKNAYINGTADFPWSKPNLK